MKKIILPISMLFVESISYAQTSIENYIQTRTYLEERTTSDPNAKQIHTVEYFDGLGRPKQIVNVKATPQGKDVVTPIVYDNFGRQIRDYLPIPQTSTNNGLIYAQTAGHNPYPVPDPSNIYGNEKIFTEKQLEDSPLNRLFEQRQVGNDWSNHPSTFGYDTNVVGEVKNYLATFNYGTFQSSISLLGDYSPKQLYKNIVIDEDGNKTIEFKDGLGKTILARKVINSTENADTYYVYNNYNQLVYIIPPLAAIADTINDSILNNLCYQYKYDVKNRLVEKKLPGRDWEFMVYDKSGRIVLNQDANLKEQNKWLITKYDSFGRVAYTGFLTGGDRISRQNDINNLVITENRNNTGFTRNGITVYYTDNTFVGEVATILSLNYYDTYPNYDFNPTFPSNILGKTVLENIPDAEGRSTKGLPLMSLIKNIEDDHWTKNYTYYDKKGRSIGMYSINHLGGYTKTESLLDFAGVLQRANTYHMRKQGEVGIFITERFIYDNQNRLLQHYHKVDNKSEVVLTDNTYNELSQLSNKNVGNNLQSIDFAYNIRGWLTDVNKNEMALSDLGGKLFSYKIKYNEKQGIDNPDQSQFSGKNVIPRYNGNVAEIDWRTVEENPSLTPKRYGYVYDKLNRLTAGYYQNPDNPYNKENIESLSYDLNGNITSLYRTSVPEFGNTTATTIDNLEYIYEGKNQVKKINDYSQNPSGYEGGGNIITYDFNGNMKNMQDKNIKSISYNFLNLPKRIEYGGGSINIDYLYNTAGIKLQKKSPRTECGIINCTTFTDVTDYLDGFQYLSSTTSGNGGGGDPVEMFTFSENSSKAMEIQAFSSNETLKGPIGMKTPDLQFFPTAEGFYDYKKDFYIYQYKDHLGNVRMSFTRTNAGLLEVIDKNDYYPFGMNHLNTGSAMFGSGSYMNYKYNGKELQETGMYDYGARFYMADIGRWGVVDPLAEKSTRWSPYTYGYNNPIRFIDPDGRNNWELQDFLNGWIDGVNNANSPASSEYKPTPKEAAAMAAHVYGDKKDNILLGGWRVSQTKFSGVRLNDRDSGFKSQVYERVVNGKVTEYVYATAGTEDITKDGTADAIQPLGVSTQYSIASANAEAISNQLGDVELTYTGHSLGGGLAALESNLTGRDAITFNAAGVGTFTKYVNGYNSHIKGWFGGFSAVFRTEGRINAYILRTDPLNGIQNGLSSLGLLMPDVNGKKHYITPSTGGSVYNGHSMDNMLKEFGINPDKYNTKK